MTSLMNCSWGKERHLEKKEITHNITNDSWLLCSCNTQVFVFEDYHAQIISLFRYVGEKYSNAQEAMERAMHTFYSQSATHRPLSKPVVGQLVTVRGQDGEELSRAQVLGVMAHNTVKVTNVLSWRSGYFLLVMGLNAYSAV